jgi:hypothetical protein
MDRLQELRNKDANLDSLIALLSDVGSNIRIALEKHVSQESDEFERLVDEIRDELRSSL